MSAAVIPLRVLERAASFYVVDETGCHISRYSVGSHGYAQVGWQEDGKAHTVLVHRAVWIRANGPIPDGMTIDHTCKVRPCGNLTHLRLLSNFENARRTAGRDWPEGECVNGHSNEFLRYRGSKLECQVCAQIAWTKYNRKKRGVPIRRAS